ncbi:MAG: hypothetical protein AAFP19_22540, partial [Bacteroidota bacterium]
MNINCCKTVLIALLSLILLAPSCYIDDSSANPITPLPYTTVEGMFDSIGLAPDFYQIDVSEEVELVTEGGSQLLIPKGALKRADGSEVSGEVELELVELFSKSDMLLSNIPTVSEGQLLESGGAFQLLFRKDGDLLQLNEELKLTFPIHSEVANPEDMEVFYGRFDGAEPDERLWLPAQDGSRVVLQDTTVQSTYQMYFNNLDWINCDRFYDLNAPKTAISATPTSFGTILLDAQGFVVFKNLNSVMRMDYRDDFFSAFNVPEGEEVHIVLIAFDRGQ